MLALRKLRSVVVSAARSRQPSAPSRRSYTAEADQDWKSLPRDADQTDVLIVGGGPSGLSAAIRVKQLAKQSGKDIRVCLLEKGQEIGASDFFRIFVLSRLAGRRPFPSAISLLFSNYLILYFIFHPCDPKAVS
jgi:hypothetical protein